MLSFFFTWLVGIVSLISLFLAILWINDNVFSYFGLMVIIGVFIGGPLMILNKHRLSAKKELGENWKW